MNEQSFSWLLYSVEVRGNWKLFQSTDIQLMKEDLKVLISSFSLTFMFLAWGVISLSSPIHRQEHDAASSVLT